MNGYILESVIVFLHDDTVKRSQNHREKPSWLWLLKPCRRSGNDGTQTCMKLLTVSNTVGIKGYHIQ